MSLRTSGGCWVVKKNVVSRAMFVVPHRTSTSWVSAALVADEGAKHLLELLPTPAPLNSAPLITQTAVSSFSVEDTTSTVSPATTSASSSSSCKKKKEKLFNADSLHQRTLSPTACHPSPMSSGRERSVAAGSRAGEVIPFKELCQIFNLVPPEGSKVASIQYWLSSLILLRGQYRRNLSQSFDIAAADGETTAFLCVECFLGGGDFSGFGQSGDTFPISHRE